MCEVDNLHSEIYSIMCQEYKRLRGYTKEQMVKHLMYGSSPLEIYRDWVYTNKIESMCSEPYCWYIKVGAFIADEMRDQVLGLYREKTEDGWSSLKPMDEYEWRQMDEYDLASYKCVVKNMLVFHGVRIPADFDPEREYYVINIEEMEEMEEKKESIPLYCRRCGGDCHKLKDDLYCAGCHSDIVDEFMDDGNMPDDIDAYVNDMLEREAERISDIMRGK